MSFSTLDFTDNIKQTVVEQELRNVICGKSIIPARSPASRDNSKAASQSEDDDDCFVTKVEESGGTIDLLESPAPLSGQSELDDLFVEPVEISP